MKNKLKTKILWQIFKGSFAKNLSMLNIEVENSFMKKAKIEYIKIIDKIPAYGKNDILFNTIVNASVLAAIYLTLENKPSVEVMREYYKKSMCENKIAIGTIKSNNMYAAKYQNKLKEQGEKSQKASNPYTWRFTFYKGKDINSFDAVFDKCGICNLFKDLGISELTPAMCAFDYDMAEYTNTLFTRQTTIAGGGKVCDCHYAKKIK